MKPGRMLKQVIQSFFRKPVTNRYPLEKLEMAEKLRGKLLFHPSRCIGCKMCMRDCTSGAITITKVGEKQFEAEINLGRCIYCAQCVESCPKDALEFTQEIELAVLDAEKLKVVFRDQPKNSTQEKTT
jgi:formate hydrogenlyase subunit 6/NADH:ubiquinone oxidoreductase subunit I